MMCILVKKVKKKLNSESYMEKRKKFFEAQMWADFKHSSWANSFSMCIGQRMLLLYNFNKFNKQNIIL